MWKHITFCVALFVISINSTQAQQGFGQIVINAGIGFSPEFNGQIITGGLTSTAPWFPIAAYDNYSNYYPPSYSAYNITPNIGGTIDFSMLKWLSIGLAGSYQSEFINWTPITLNSYAQPPYPYNDKVTRINLAGRLLFHLNKKHLYFDHYLGCRIGGSFWHDVVYPGSYMSPLSITYIPPPAYFISRSNLVIPSFQILYGVRFYVLPDFGVNFELGIGSPYLMEGGFTYRIDTKKNNLESSPTQNTNQSNPPNQNKN